MMIQEGDVAIFKRENVIKVLKIKRKRTVVLDRYKFTPDEAIGFPYGTQFEVKYGRLVKVEREKATTANDMKGDDNRNLQDDDTNQKMTKDDIVSLKTEGATGTEIVNQLVENSATFKTKTEFSQEKYIKKKKKKHLAIFTILKPNTRLLWEMYFNKQPSKICYLRVDSLAQILNQGNIRAGSKVLLMETCQGLVLGSIMERLAGHGTIIQLYSGTQPVREVLSNYAFPQDLYKGVYCLPLNQIASLKLLRNTPVDVDGKYHVSEETELQGKESPAKEENSDASEQVNGKRKLEESTKSRRELRLEQEVNARNIIQHGDMDALILVSRFDPTPLVMKLINFLSPSRQIVVYCRYREPLVECYNKLRGRGGVISLDLTETWLRNYQVLPGRTHPEITMSGTGGYLLTGTTVEC